MRKAKRILLKLSGEALAGDKGFGIDQVTIAKFAEEISEIHKSGIEIALVSHSLSRPSSSFCIPDR